MECFLNVQDLIYCKNNNGLQVIGYLQAIFLLIVEFLFCHLIL